MNSFQWNFHELFPHIRPFSRKTFRALIKATSRKRTHIVGLLRYETHREIILFFFFFYLRNNICEEGHVSRVTSPPENTECLLYYINM